MPPVAQPPEVTNIMNVINTHLRWKNLNGPPRGHEVYHPSAFGGCLRRMQYQRYAERGWIVGEEEAKDPKTLRIFDTGHSLHARWASYFEEVGVLRGVWECANLSCSLWDNKGVCNGLGDYPDHRKYLDNRGEISRPRVYGKDNKLGIFKPKVCACGCNEFKYHEITVEDKSLNFRGHCDQVLDFSEFDPNKYKSGQAVDVLFKQEDLPKKPIVLDMKSINSFNFKSKLDNGPSLVYRTQLVIYCNILDLDYGVLVYENKDDSSTKIYKVDRNIDLWNKIQEQATKMNDMIEEKLLPPPRPISKDEYECRYCEFQSMCHKSKAWDHPELHQQRLNFYGILE